MVHLDELAGQVRLELVGARQRLFPASGEINSEIADARAVTARVHNHYAGSARAVDLTDGLSMEFDQWRLNLRASNTEPLVRLNVESRGSEALMRDKTAEVLQLMSGT